MKFEYPTQLLFDNGLLRPTVRIDPRPPNVNRRLNFIKGLLRWLINIIVLWISRKLNCKTHAVITRELFESLGYLWVKAGQLLSLRTDIFSSDFCQEMSRLQYNAVGFSPKISRDIVERELGCTIESVFAEFYNLPFAAASMSQVHRGRLHNKNSFVVVKVMRPDTDKIFEMDMAILNWIFSVLNRFSFFSKFKLSKLGWELDQIRVEETDYRYELSNMERMGPNLVKHKVYTPKVYPAYCTRNVLVTEFVDGVLMSDYIRARETDPARVTAWCEANNINPVAVANRIYNSFLRQLFEDNIYHGDLHPGNIMLLKNSRFALIDFGTVGVAEGAMWRKYLFFMKAIATGDFGLAADLALTFCGVLPIVDVSTIKEDMIRVMRFWYSRTPISDLPHHEKSLATSLQVELIKIGVDQSVFFEWEFLKLDRTWITMDSSMASLNPETDYPRLYRDYFKSRRVRTYWKVVGYRQVLRSTLEGYDEFSYYSNLISSGVRASGRMFSGGSNVISNLMAEYYDILVKIIVLFFCVVIITFGQQHYGFLGYLKLNENHIISTVDRWLSEIPEMPFFAWSIIIIGTLLSLARVRKARQIFRRDDVRLPQ